MSRVVWDQSRFDRDLGELRKGLRQTIKAAALGSAIRTSKHAHDTKFIEANPPFLNRQTGRAARSIAASPRAYLTPDSAIGEWGSNVGYVVKHERGGTHREFIRLHRVREHTRLVKRHQAAFLVTGAGAATRTVTVRAHAVSGHYAFRHYRRRAMIATAAREMADYPGLAARASVELLIQRGKPPTAGMVINAVGV